MMMIMTQVALSGHCIHHFFECGHLHQQEREGGGARPVREVYSGAGSLTPGAGVMMVMMMMMMMTR